MIRELAREAAAHPWRTLADTLALLLLWAAVLSLLFVWQP